MTILRRNSQTGVSLGGLLVIMFVVVVVGIFALKLIPVYIEYAKCKSAIVAISSARVEESQKFWTRARWVRPTCISRRSRKECFA